ncbi:uncharacterized protein V6R79_019897 [Siganus canaliculatus]
MDPAEKEQMAAILRAQEARLSQQEEYQKAMALWQVRDLLDHLRQTSSSSVAPQTQAAAPGPPAPDPPAPVSPAPYTGSGIKLASPERYSGDPGQCKAFLTDCDIHFEHSPQAFPTDRSRVAFMVSHLTGRARAWAAAEWARDSPLCASVTDFRAALRRVFDPALIDSGADESLIDWDLVRQYQIKTEPLSKPIKARALNGCELFTITHATEPLELQIDDHKEHIIFHVFESPSQTLVLGHPWLRQHNPHVNWNTGKILGWGEDCTPNIQT